ncbi:hypothetical protein BJY04DRAFT_194093 [Aspergillus karnatakaensis]|uniref:uncharacterized protein n=1 Tax=Aspergillus karnatakaensis TaxID=1810916 RepID=UPI003CCCB0AB
MTFFPADRRRFISRSAIPLPFYINIGLVVDDVLDTTILQNKYAQLIGRSPVLGGVLRSKKDTRKFSCGSTADFEARVINSDIPFSFSTHGDGQPSILHDNLATVDSAFIFNASCDPKPVCRMRATIFDDATLLCFSFVHGLFDGPSAFSVLRYFCDLLSGKAIPRLSLPPDATGSRMSDRVRAPEDCEWEVPETRKMFVTTKFGHLRVKAETLFTKVIEKLGFSERTEHRLVHLSSAWVEEVRSKAQKELEGTTSITHADVIAALYLKVFYKPRPVSRKPVDLISPMNYRSLREPVEGGTEYTHNSSVLVRCELSEQQVQTESIGQAAQKIRIATIEGERPSAIKQQLRFIEDQVVAPAVPKIRGSLKWGCPVVTSWTELDFSSLNFSGASHRDRNPSVVFVNPEISPMGGTARSPFLVTVGDGAGGYWLRAANTASGWEAFDHCTSLKTLFCAVDKY